MKTIGMVGGMSWISTIEYYRALNTMVNEKLGNNNAAKCILYSLNYQEIIEMNNMDDVELLKATFLSASKTLEAAGADCIMLGANTAHRFAEHVQVQLSIPVIHIGDATLQAVEEQNIKTIALLGTRFTMELDFIKKRFTDKGIRVLIPAADDRSFIHDTIGNELGKGIFSTETRQRYVNIIESLVSQGAGGVILGCTEIPLLISPQDISVPSFDTMQIHAAAAVAFALS